MAWFKISFSKASLWMVCLFILLVGYVISFQRGDQRSQRTIPEEVLNMEEYTDMGRVIVFGSAPPEPGRKSIGKGQCPLCHTFEPGDNIGRCPNLFGVEQRSHTRIKESRYLNAPIKIGETDQRSGIVKGRPDLIPEEYRRKGSPELIGEDYLREEMMCPSCYVVKGYGKVGDTKSLMPLIHKPPISLTRVELNAVIAWLQAKDTPGDFSRVTVPLPTLDEMVPKADPLDEYRFGPIPHGDSGGIQEMINMMGCPLCHIIPGIEGASGELGPPLHMEINAPERLKDPRYKGKARTAREYVKESILNHDVYIVFNEAKGEPYPSGLLSRDHYSSKLSIKALEKLVDFISNTQPE